MLQPRLVIFAMCAVLTGLFTSPVSADGKLARARAEAHGSSNHSSSRRDSSSSHSESHDSVETRPRHYHRHSRRHSAHVAAVSCMSPSCGYTYGAEDYTADSEVAELNGYGYPTYASYPYATPSSPYLLEPALQVASTSPALDARLLAEHQAGRPLAGQLSLDAGYLAGIGQSNFTARLLTPGPIELMMRNAVLWEPAQRDYSVFAVAALGLRFAQSRNVMLRATAGLVYFGQFGDLLVGTELGLSMDIFIGRPWVLSANGAIAILGEVLAPQARVQLGYLFGRSELFVGYQYLQVGSVDLSAPVFGTRIWL